LAVTIGIYLPLELAVPIFAGGLIHYATKRYHKRLQTPAKQIEASGRHGLLFASGLITGEALMGILLAIPIILLKQFDVDLPIIEHFSGRAMPYGGWLGAVLLVGVAFWLYRTARGNGAQTKS
ncbi:MAG: OPT/YSL family transporter, partial [Planctomycetota bacterium]